MLKKDDTIQLTIEDMSVDGSGVGKYEGMTFFVKDAIIGDVISAKIMKLKKTYGYARLMELLTPSEARVEPRCPVHRQCGGCQIQAMSYEKQLEYKQNKVKNNLIRLGGFADVEALMEPIIGMEEPYHYRNKAQFPIGMNKEGKPIYGFYAGRTHSIIPVEDCALAVPVKSQIMKAIMSWMKQCKISAYDEKTGTGLMRHVLLRYGFTTKEIMVCLVINSKSLPKHSIEPLIQALTGFDGMTSISFSPNEKNTNVIMGDSVTTIWGQDYITDYIGDIQYQISPLSFYQVNPVQTKKLYDVALKYANLTGQESVWDLYCGIGTISLFLAQAAKQVYGVEIVPQAIDDANKNARLNQIENVTFFVGKAEEVVPDFYKEAAKEQGEMLHPDVIVVDPPRKGCEEELLKTMVEMSPKRIVYVSCDSATLARDLKYLCENGYDLQKVQVVDQFCHSVHTEAVVLLTK